MTPLEVKRLSFSESELASAWVSLARSVGLAFVHAPAPPAEGGVEDWRQHVESVTGTQLTPVSSSYSGLQKTLMRCAPALVRCRIRGENRYFALRDARRGRCQILSSSVESTWIPSERLQAALVQPLLQGPEAAIGDWLQHLGIPERRQGTARHRLLGWLLAERTIDGLWLLAPDAGAGLGQQLRASGATPRLVAAGAQNALSVVLNLVGWGILGSSALEGDVQPDWMWAWGLCLLSGALLRATSGYRSGHVLNELAALLDRRLLQGALRLPLHELRGTGTGQSLATVAEAQVFQSTLLAGLSATALSCFQLLGAVWVLAQGAQSPWLLTLVALWLLLLLAGGYRFYRLRSNWTRARFQLSRGYLENLLGHRTRRAQQAPERWHREEDLPLDAYLQASLAMDRLQSILTVIPTRGWLVLGLLGLTPAFFGAAEPSGIALALGGIVQANVAFATLGASGVALVCSAVAWQHVGRLFQAARGASADAAPLALPPARDVKGPLLSAHGVSFRYPGSSTRVLSECQLELRSGDRVLVQGPSGEGKSTLAGLLVGLLRAETGNVLCQGLDRESLGSVGWHRRVCSVPQFHDNHIFSGSLAFNLLMGRAWPASPRDLQRATSVCEELGLGPLLRRMPAGVNQALGDAGWQLSHGERSRVFLARALLQDPDVLILDESLAALDPRTLKTCFEAVDVRARSLMVIAHP